MRDFTIRSNTNGLGLRSNAIKDLCPLILHQLVVGWIGKAHGPTTTHEMQSPKIPNTLTVFPLKQLMIQNNVGSILRIDETYWQYPKNANLAYYKLPHNFQLVEL